MESARRPQQGKKTPADLSPSNSSLRLQRVSISTAETFPNVEIKEKLHSLPFIFSRFQSGKQIHVLKYIVLVRGGWKGSFLLIKNKLSRAPSRCPALAAFSVRLFQAAPGAPAGPWDARGKSTLRRSFPFGAHERRCLLRLGALSLPMGLPKHLFLFKREHQY